MYVPEEFVELAKRWSWKKFAIGGAFSLLQKAENGAYAITAVACGGSFSGALAQYIATGLASLEACLGAAAVALTLTFVRGGIEANGDQWLFADGYGIKVFNDTLHVPIGYYLDIHGIQQTYKVTEPNSDVEVIWVVVPNQGNDTKLLIESSTEPILILRYHGKRLVSLVGGYSVQDHMEWLLTGNNYNGSVGTFISGTKDTQQWGAVESAFYLGEWEDRPVLLDEDGLLPDNTAAFNQVNGEDMYPPDSLHQKYCLALENNGNPNPGADGAFLAGEMYLNSKGSGDGDCDEGINLDTAGGLT